MLSSPHMLERSMGYVEVGKDRSLRDCTLIHAERSADSELVRVELEAGLSTVSYHVGQSVISKGDLGIPPGTEGVVQRLRHPQNEFFLYILFSGHKLPTLARMRSIRWPTAN